MSASVMFHGPFTSGARLVDPKLYGGEPFVSLDLTTRGASASLIAVTAEDLDGLAEAIAAARELLPVKAAS